MGLQAAGRYDEEGCIYYKILQEVMALPFANRLEQVLLGHWNTWAWGKGHVGAVLPCPDKSSQHVRHTTNIAKGFLIRVTWPMWMCLLYGSSLFKQHECKPPVSVVFVSLDLHKERVFTP